MKKFTFLWALCLLGALTSYGQNGSDPAVTVALITPSPLPAVNSPFSMTFSIGNSGSTAITGQAPVDQMSFTVNIFNSTLNGGLSGVSGPITTYFDLTLLTATDGTQSIDGIQKAGVPITANTLVDIIISATSSSTATENIGAGVELAPNGFSTPQPSGNDHLSVFTNVSAPMPVSLVWFKAEPQADKTVLVSWQTSMESANKGYVVERSKDLKRFEPVGEITDVAANSKTLQTYRFTDATPYRGTSYYRLRQVDLSGLSHEYAAVPVSLDGVYGVYPNPVASTGFTLSLDEPSSAVLRFYSATGRAISLEKSSSSERSVELKPSEKLSTGIYVLQVEERGQLRTHRLVVQ